MLRVEIVVQKAVGRRCSQSNVDLKRGLACAAHRLQARAPPGEDVPPLPHLWEIAPTRSSEQRACQSAVSAVTLKSKPPSCLAGINLRASDVRPSSISKSVQFVGRL